MGFCWINEISDEAMAHWRYNTDAAPAFKAGGLSLGGGLLEWWEQSYSIIRKLNEFIQRVPSSPIDARLRDQKMAEARFLRAYNYFSMVKRYGAVPLIKVPQNIDDPKEELYAPRTSEQKIYDFIISEMQDVVSKGYLPDVANAVSGRPTRYAALALISRAALYAGSIAQFGKVQLDGLLGIPEEEAGYYYRISYDASKEIGKHFSLYRADEDKVTNFKNIFLVKNNSESIFVKHHEESANTQNYAGQTCWGWDFAQCPKPHAWSAGNKDAPYLGMAEEFEYADGRPGKFDNRGELESKEWTIDELWGGRDPRFYATLYTQGTLYREQEVDFHNGLLVDGKVLIDEGSYKDVPILGTQTVDNNYGTGFGIMKYLDKTSNTLLNQGNSDSDYIIFRYGEILLNLAEAAFELGIEKEALDAVNELRDRAGVAELKSIDRDKIRHERKVELAFEGHRYWDVRRWRIAENVLSRPNSGLRYILVYDARHSDAGYVPKYKVEILDNVDGSSFAPKFHERNYYFPITLGRTGNNPNLKENPGYTD